MCDNYEHNITFYHYGDKNLKFLTKFKSQNAQQK
jgi:hypothetical protein